ncbi:hypothetical protein [Mesorhizobium sp. WSM3859]|uniref:hypothetical protein n=1 Tax=Mesorhizobium sp. WSM3859 TaxID=2029402 RepID=UPI000BD13E1B|nr:hypothetical protein [Mesorhizobium sp. WSM3859]PBC09453.1 hypothetical protein CK230_15080 [Mesorhizobium sp. WSM3859]
MTKQESSFQGMPEQPEKWPRGAAWTLTRAHDAGQVAGIRCGKCNIRRFYKPLELREVIGQRYDRRGAREGALPAMRQPEWMDAELFHPTGEQAHTMRYRRLVQIRWEKRVIWRDE